MIIYKNTTQWQTEQYDLIAINDLQNRVIKISIQNQCTPILLTSYREGLYQLNQMIDPSEDTLVKIDALISGIRMTNLHIYNFFAQITNPKPSGKLTRQQQRLKSFQDFKRLNIAHLQEHSKFISEYVRKYLKDMAKVKISLSPAVYRPLRNQAIHNQNFLRYENQNYGVKFIFTELIKECLMNIEIYRKVGGIKINGVAMRKLQMFFTHDLAMKNPDSQFTQATLRGEGEHILEEVKIIFNGQKCSMCGKHFAFDTQLMVYLPPTIREVYIQARQGGRKQRKVGYYHQSCCI